MSLSSLMAGARKERILSSKQFRDGAFRNTSGAKPELRSNSFSLLGEYARAKDRTPSSPIPTVDPREVWTKRTTGLRVTWLGHSTVLLELDGLRILTDPVFGDRASPVDFAGPKRFFAPPVPLHTLTDIDLVLLSHDHYDHLCEASIRTIASFRAPIVTSLGVGARLESLGIPAKRIVELDWWESKEVPDARLRISATPAQHFSGRGLGDGNKTLWSSWVLESEHTRVFFSGDTGLTPEFKAIHQRFGNFDLTMLEVGAFHPAWGSIHLGPDNAASAFEMLGGGTLLPVHWGTFNLALHPWKEPVERLLELAKEKDLRVLFPKPGECFLPSEVEIVTPWWRGLS